MLLKVIAFGSSGVGQEEIVAVPSPFAQEEFVKAEVQELCSAEQVIMDTSQGEFRSAQ